MATRGRVAVIGGGLAGASFVDALNGMRPDIKVEVFEREPGVGGRFLSEKQGNVTCELGSNFLLGNGKVLVDLVFKHDCGIDPALKPEDDIAIVDGSGVANSGTRLSLITKGIFRYGLSLVGFGSLVKAKANAMAAIQPRVQIGSNAPFQSPGEIIHSLGDSREFSTNALEFCNQQGYNDRLTFELIQGMSRFALGQNLDRVNAAAVLQAFTSAVVASFYVRGGIQALLTKVFKKANLNLGAQVTAIDQSASGYVVQYTQNGVANSKEFDAVFIATPLGAFSNIQINVPGVLPVRPSQLSPISVTFVAGALNAQFFGANVDFSENIVFGRGTEGKFANIKGLQKVAENFALKSGGSGKLYRILSDTPLTDQQLSLFFYRSEIVTQKHWPFGLVNTPADNPNSLEPFRIAPGLYQSSSMEKYLGNMEMQAIAGRNVANLLAKTEPHLL